MSKEDTKAHWVEFRTLKDLFTFVITKTMPGQQFVSLMHYKQHTYVFSPVNDTLMVFFTREEPKSNIYAWDAEKDEFTALSKADRTRVNILIQDVAQDTLISSIFYK